MFYQQLSRWYDEVFPFNPDAGRFLQSILPDRGRILDLACGTGTYSLFLAESGFEVVGVDLEPNMVNQAREKDAEGKASFYVRDMLQCQDLGLFDGILCLGNSLAHLMSEAQLNAFFANASAQLRARGCLVIQIVNYDRILAHGAVELPLIETPHVVFRRTYTPLQDGRLEFASKLSVRVDESAEEEYHSRIFLNPLRAEWLADVLRTNGFSAEFFGGFAQDPFKPEESYSLVIVASPVAKEQPSRR